MNESTSIARSIRPTAHRSWALFDRTSVVGRLLRIKLAMYAMVVITVLVVVGVLAPVIAPYSPEALITFGSDGPSAAHWLGTDQLGRDQLSRLVFGARASLTVATLTMLIGVSFGSLLGLTSAYFGGVVDSIMMRWIDAIRAVPGIILPLMLVMIIGGSVFTVSVALGFSLMTAIGRLMRGQALAIKQRDYVLAAASLGASGPRIMFRHIAPNCWSPIIVSASLGMSGAITAEAGLSFLGVGVQPPTATWGQMLSSGLSAIRLSPWQVIAPGVSIFLVVLAFNFIGDALRDVLDPRLRGKM